MALSGTFQKILADTRAADQVIRLSRDAAPKFDIETKDDTNEVYYHEWVHYFQFTSTPSGVFLSQYRRNCFDRLKEALIASPDGVYDTRHFREALSNFNLAWESWPVDWWQVGQADRRRIETVTIEPDGWITASFGDSDLAVRLPIGLHAIYEAMAWCSARLTTGAESVDIPSDPRSLVYTWPLWLDTYLKDHRVDGAPLEELAGVLPLLLIACLYESRVLPDPKVGMPDSFLDIHSDLSRRNVTAGRVIWQLFRDYRPFWSNAPTSRNINAYLMRIGLPSMDDVLRMTVAVTDQSARDLQSSLDEIVKSLDDTDQPLMMDVLAEIDLLATSRDNLQIVGDSLDRAVVSPILIADELAPAIVAVETDNGYQWLTVTTGREERHPRWLEQNKARNLLRQQLSMTEHVMMHMAFGDHLACYGNIDWRLPVNLCPVASECMALEKKRGIQFCVDHAWREKVAEIVAGVFNHHRIPPPENIYPGISKAIDDWLASRRGEGPTFERTFIDLRTLNLRGYQ